VKPTDPITLQRAGLYLRYLLIAAAALLAGRASGVMACREDLEAYRLLRMEVDGSDVIEKAIDGDTVDLRGDGLCRIMGVDTPEVWQKVGAEWQQIEDPDPNGVRASEWVRSLEGRRVRVQYGKRERDRYGRRLVHLYVLPDGPDVACELLRRGWGKVMAIPPNLERYKAWKRAAAQSPHKRD